MYKNYVAMRTKVIVVAKKFYQKIEDTMLLDMQYMCCICLHIVHIYR